jgi:hypothetical protein
MQLRETFTLRHGWSNGRMHAREAGIWVRFWAVTYFFWLRVNEPKKTGTRSAWVPSAAKIH